MWSSASGRPGACCGRGRSFAARTPRSWGQVFCSFLALVLREELRRRMAERGIEAEWADLMRDLQRLQATHLRLQGKHFAVRSRTQGVVAQVMRCVGARLPPTIRQEDTVASSPATQPAERTAPATEESAVSMPARRSPSIACMQRSKCSATADLSNL